MAGRSDVLAGRATVILGVLDNVSKPMAKIAAGLAGFGLALRHVSGLVAAFSTDILETLGNSVKRFAETGDRFEAMAIRTGIATDKLRELAYVAEQNGTSIDVMELALRRMQRTISFASLGMADMSKLLGEIGLKAEDIEGMGAAEQFNAIGAAIANINDPSRQRGAALLWFGKSGTNVLPVQQNAAKTLERLKKLRPAFSKEATALGDTMKDMTADVATSFEGVEDAIGTALAPVLLPLLELLSRATSALATFLTENKNATWYVVGFAAGLAGVAGALAATGLAAATASFAMAGLASAVVVLSGAMSLLTAAAGLAGFASLGAAISAAAAAATAAVIPISALVAATALVASTALLVEGALDAAFDVSVDDGGLSQSLEHIDSLFDDIFSRISRGIEIKDWGLVVDELIAGVKALYAVVSYELGTWYRSVVSSIREMIQIGNVGILVLLKGVTSLLGPLGATIGASLDEQLAEAKDSFFIDKAVDAGRQKKALEERTKALEEYAKAKKLLDERATARRQELADEAAGKPKKKDPVSAEELEETAKLNKRLRALDDERYGMSLSQNEREIEAIRNKYREEILEAEGAVWRQTKLEELLTAEIILQKEKQAQAAEEAAKKEEAAMEKRLRTALEAEKIAGIQEDAFRKRAEIEQEYMASITDPAATQATDEAALALKREKMANLEKQEADARAAERRKLMEEIITLGVDASTVLSDMEKEATKLGQERIAAIAEVEGDAMMPSEERFAQLDLIDQKFRLEADIMAQKFADVTKEMTASMGAFGGQGLAQQMDSSAEETAENTKKSAEFLAKVAKNTEDIALRAGLTF